jgi:hypothetical protein
MYCSAASRTTQASETFFSSAITSSVSYTSGGKLIETRTAGALLTLAILRPLFAIMMNARFVSPHYTTSVNVLGHARQNKSPTHSKPVLTASLVVALLAAPVENVMAKVSNEANPQSARRANLAAPRPGS